jgi:hypothetical protein
LSPEDESRLEEAYFDDRALFERIEALEEELIEDYVRGNLSDHERRRFERHYLASEPRRARIEVTRRMVEVCSLRAAARRGARNRISDKTLAVGSRLRSLAGQPLAWVWGVTAVCLLILGTGTAVGVFRLREELDAIRRDRATLEQRVEDAERRLAHERELLNEERAEKTALQQRVGIVNRQMDRLRQDLAGSRGADDRIVSLVLTPGVRGIANLESAVIRAGIALVELRLSLERSEAAALPAYRVVVKTADGGREIWAQESIKPQRNSSVRQVIVRVPAGRFRKAGGHDFILTLEGTAADGSGYEELENCYFQVTSR